MGRFTDDTNKVISGITAGTSAGTSSAVRFENLTAARVWSTAGAGTSFNLYECDEKNGTYVQCFDKSNTAISVDVSNGSTFINAEIFPAMWIKFVGATGATLKLVGKP